MVRWHNSHKLSTGRNNMTRGFRGQGMRSESGGHAGNNNDSNNNSGPGQHMDQPFTQFDTSDSAAPETPADSGSEVWTSPCGRKLTAGQLARFQNPVCVSSKSAKELYPRLGSVSPPYLMLESLIYLVCRMHGQDDEEADSLFTQVCGQLERCGFLAASYRMDPTHRVHQVFGSTFSKLLLDLQSERSAALNKRGVVPLLNGRHDRLLHQFQIGDFIDQSRYRRSFGKKTLIARGGFGTVFRARHSLDEVDYALKVITFRVRSVDDYVRILREVQLYANLPAHANVVTYKTAWLESQFDPCLNQEENRPEDGNKIEEVTANQFGGTNDGRAMTTATTTTTTATNTTTTNNSSSSHSSSHSNSSIVFEGTNGTTAATEDRDEELVMQQEGKVNGKESLSETSTGPTLVRRTSGHRSRADSASDSAIDYGIVRIPSSPPTQKPLIELPESRESGMGRESRGRRLERISVTLYIQMELCGMNLKTWITRRNRSVYRDFERISESEGESGDREFVMSNEEYHKCLTIFRHILTGVSFLHTNHLIHRDLKPQNILFDVSEGTVKIGDFGLATLHEEDVHVEHSPLGAATSNTGANISFNGHTIGMGTTLYVAPEQRVSSRYDVKADMYSLGIILFELLHPFNTVMEKEKRITDLKTASLLPPDFVSRFPSAAQVIRQLTSVDPSDRPSADQVLRSDLFPSKDQVIHDLESQVQRLQEENRRLLHLLRLKDRQAKVL